MKSKPWYKKYWIWIIIIVIVAFPLIINEAYKLNVGYYTLWNAADVLSYYGSFIGAGGTIILGIIAWQQNSRLLQIEESTFIANNACIGYVEQVVIDNGNQKACNLELHGEQIVSTLKDYTKNYSSYNIRVNMSMKENIATLVKINKIILIISNHESQQTVLDFHSIDSEFSCTSICPDGIMFNITLLISSEEKKSFIRSTNNIYSNLIMEIDFTLLTDKYVSSHLICRSELIQELSKLEEQDNYSKKTLTNNYFMIDKNVPPLCFWQGNNILKKDTVEIKMRKT